MAKPGRCCVKYCDGAGAVPVELMKNLHLLLCTGHGREWQAEHASANIKYHNAHERWTEWLKQASHRCWQAQSETRRALEHNLATPRAQLRAQELNRFRSEISKQSARKPEASRPSTTETLALANRALRRVARLVRASGYAPSPTFTRLAATLPHRK